ncbi:Hypothetical predicted protein [Octopus vulgaris]|uniref:Uncharacterized protein n=1 Tax=Octopus vulgaris TaxID=6645 RepID=A0AA36ASE9_OCTVU|nr:Hypothetical predicted protein [Octopus vulgaris]
MSSDTDCDFDAVWLQQSSQIQNSLPISASDQSIENGDGGKSDTTLHDGNNQSDVLKEDMKVLTGDSGLNPGQHYLIVSKDTADVTKH